MIHKLMNTFFGWLHSAVCMEFIKSSFVITKVLVIFFSFWSQKTLFPSSKMVLNPAVANIASAFLLNDAHRRELMARTSRVANVTPAFRWNEDVIMAAFQTGWSTMAHEFSLAIPWSNDFREWLLSFLVEHEFGDLLEVVDEFVVWGEVVAVVSGEELVGGGEGLGGGDLGGYY